VRSRHRKARQRQQPGGTGNTLNESASTVNQQTVLGAVEGRNELAAKMRKRTQKKQGSDRTLPFATFAPSRGQLASSVSHPNLARRNRNAFAITDTELKLIAAAASMGLSNRPNAG
jgi:hypothetical protein